MDNTEFKEKIEEYLNKSLDDTKKNFLVDEVENNILTVETNYTGPEGDIEFFYIKKVKESFCVYIFTNVLVHTIDEKHPERYISTCNKVKNFVSLYNYTIYGNMIYSFCSEQNLVRNIDNMIYLISVMSGAENILKIDDEDKEE